MVHQRISPGLAAAGVQPLTIRHLPVLGALPPRTLIGAKAYYQSRRAAGDTREAALHRVDNKLLGRLHYCLAHRELTTSIAPGPHSS
jgi:hypothetical protein